MSKTDMGGPAYPVNDQGELLDEGMTLWDYYAAHCPEKKIDLALKDGMSVAEACASYANSMLAQRAARMKQPDHQEET